MTWRLCLITVAIALGNVGSANAQFGLKCDVPTFSSDLEASHFSDDVKAAVRAKCAFGKKYEEIKDVFGKGAWSWDLLPKARIDVAELTALGDKAAELNFKTGDLRALGNIRSIFVLVSDQQKWLRDNEAKFAARQRKLESVAARAAAAQASGSQTASENTFVFVVFQDQISDADRKAFLDAYKVSIVEGPNADGAYKLNIESALPRDQMSLVLSSMRSQVNVVKTAFAK